jgi:hypothetical protein
MLEWRKFRKYRHFEHSKMKIRLKGLAVTIGIESGAKLTIGEKLPHATRDIRRRFAACGLLSRVNPGVRDLSSRDSSLDSSQDSMVERSLAASGAGVRPGFCYIQSLVYHRLVLAWVNLPGPIVPSSSSKFCTNPHRRFLSDRERKLLLVTCM